MNKQASTLRANTDYNREEIIRKALHLVQENIANPLQGAALVRRVKAVVNEKAPNGNYMHMKGRKANGWNESIIRGVLMADARTRPHVQRFVLNLNNPKQETMRPNTQLDRIESLLNQILEVMTKPSLNGNIPLVGEIRERHLV